MDLNQLKQILDLVREHELSEFEIEHEGLRLKIRKDAVGHAWVTPAGAVAGASSVAPGPRTVPAAALSPATELPVAASGGETAIDLAVVKSPIVGTFYRSPEPGAPPFVEVGSTVKKGQVLCIIEAMKLMNEIDSECDGEVTNIYVESGQSVQYGERLFAIRTK
ncbi:MAG: acetyl-CoA carboxylase, biotin carboxyl carrier protein [Acidobacteria bacterium RIFCSPLOWO2_12_FULL_65_11]|nr:MAG: acetyl-CoA carboxylase, biotin carboxyl carrier protein [Acidobacteria bacterium RIFCSPLOWO2_02_FULL_64_15]OFW34414.1 MAG: acetyl-CoA carboxylase, biotin carboxyl carrier protein [Acidobacteria bacterium RIFCSPLOWO2_12_FULL_65_11]